MKRKILQIIEYVIIVSLVIAQTFIVSACASNLPATKNPASIVSDQNQPGNKAVVPSSTITGASGGNPDTGTYGNFYLGIVNFSGGTVSGDGCYDDTGNIIVLINNKNSINPSYTQLEQFLMNDKTDEYPYVETGKEPGPISGSPESHIDVVHIQNIIDGIAQPGPPDVCADFAERLHNDAEFAGIRCAFVIVDTSLGYHALNAFQTTDDGLVFIDDTGVVSGACASHTDTPRCVKTVNIEPGQDYVPVSLFPYAGWSSTWDSMGKVLSFQITWDGTWDN
jgi:hypothetical protein